MHSPVFSKMFFGQFIEREKMEVEQSHYLLQEFVQLLLVFFPEPIESSDQTVFFIAKLADRFEIKGVLNAVEKHLLASRKLTNEMKLRVAESYRFDQL
ncbi:hypothetical protein PMAYCL1PPCAC_19462, partial [Pristionchus mayeri]